MTARPIHAKPDRAWPDLTGPLLVGGSYFIVAALTLLTRSSSGPLLSWVPGAILLAALLLAKRLEWLRYFAAVFTALLAANLLAGRPILLSGVLSIVNLIEAAIPALLLGRHRNRRVDFDRTGDVLHFITGCMIGGLAAAVLAGPIFWLFRGHPIATSCMIWFTTHTLGLLLITPMLVIGHRIVLRDGSDALATLSGWGISWPLLLVLAVSLGVFLQTSLPLLFAIFPAMLLATFRLRALGATTATLIILMVGAWCTMDGTGPVQLAAVGESTRTYLLQFFIAVVFLSALPVAALLTERDAHAAAARASEQRYRSVIDQIGEIIFRADGRGRWTFLNPAWKAMVGYDVEETLGSSFLNHIVQEDRPRILARMIDLYQGRTAHVHDEVRYVTREGDQRWMEISSERLFGAHGEVIGTTGTLRDTTDRKALETQIANARQAAEIAVTEARTLVATDELTGLASRRHFLAELDREMRRAKARGSSLALAIFDVDRFKRINDRLGHGVGDKVLRAIAAISVRAVRTGDLVGRLGGEEFGVIMSGASAEAAELVGERLRGAIAAATIAPLDAPVTVSIGIAVLKDGADVETLLSAADTALYQAKRAGRNHLTMAA